MPTLVPPCVREPVDDGKYRYVLRTESFTPSEAARLAGKWAEHEGDSPQGNGAVEVYTSAEVNELLEQRTAALQAELKTVREVLDELKAWIMRQQS